MAVRRESVQVDMTGNVTPELIKASLAAKTFEQTLNSLSGTAVRTSRGSVSMNRTLDGTTVSAGRADTSINQLTGRLRVFADIAAVLTPTIAPVGGVLVAGMAGLANQLGVAALAGGTAIVAFQGVGDALTAVNEAALRPTKENLEKAREALSDLSPAARRFVRSVQEMRPAFAELRDSAAEGLFPGLIEALDSIESRFPDLERVLSVTGGTLGNLIAQGAEGLAGGEWDEFFNFLATDAQDTLVDLGATVGSLTRGMAELWMAVDPLSDDFSGWMRNAAADFASWADGLSETEGFAEFVEYVRANGPQVAETFVALGDAILQIVEAAAPLGGPVLASLEAVAKVIGAVADSDLGTPIMAGVAALAIYNRMLAVAVGLQAKMGLTGAGAAAQGKGAGLAGHITPGTAVLGGALVNSAVSEQGSKFEVADVNLGNASPINAINALIQRDADKFILSDLIKRAFTGPDVEEGVKNLQQEIAYTKALSADGWDGTGLQGALLGPLTDTAEQAHKATLGLQDLIAEYEALAGLLTQQGQWDAYQASLDAMTASIKENGRTLDANTAKGRANRASLNDIAESALNFSENLKGVDRIDFLKGARRSFKQAAEAAGGLDRRSRDVLAAFDELIGKNIKPKVDDSDVKGADTTAKGLKKRLGEVDSAKVSPWVKLYGVPEADAALAGLTRPRTVKVNVAMGSSTAALEAKVSADGSTVPDDGGTYADRFPYMLAPGEEVISNRFGQADRHRDLLKAINAGRLADGGSVPGLASGGTAKPGKSGKSGKNAVWIPDGVEVPNSLKGLARAIKESERALSRETSARDDLAGRMSSLGSDVSGGILGELFGATDSWSAGSTVQDAIGRLDGQIAGGNSLTSQINTLKSKGLEGGALAELLSTADSATIANFAAASAKDLDLYEKKFEVRASVAATASSAAQAAAFGAELKPVVAAVNKVEERLRVLEKIERNAPKETGKQIKRGAGNGARNTKRG